VVYFVKKGTSVKKRNGKKKFSGETIKRLSLYLRNLKQMREQGIELISSEQVTGFLNVSPVQFRKDLSYFGGFGKRGVGYRLERLIQEIEKILGANRSWDIVLVGVGRLGSALLEFEGFSRFNLRLTCAFDSDKAKVGTQRGGITIENASGMEGKIKRENIRLAVLCVPPEVAQATVERLVSCGIQGILNFAPVALKVSPKVSVANVDMACELESLIFFAKQRALRTK
jgi:redox-sensing transcriptional repressor